MKKTYFIIIVVVMFCLNISRFVNAETQVTEEIKLPEGLVINERRIKILSIDVSPYSKAKNNLKFNERIIWTKNPLFKVIITYIGTHTISLRIEDNNGKIISEFKPMGTWVLIPKDRDIMWSTGKRSGARGYSKELYLYDIKGNLIKIIGEEITGTNDQMFVLDNGDLICLNSKGLLRINHKGEIIWKNDDLYSAKYYNLKVFSDGKYLSIESHNQEKNKREIFIINEKGEVIHKYSDSIKSKIKTVGISSNMKYSILQKRSVLNQNLMTLFIYKLDNPEHILKEIEINEDSILVDVTNDLRTLIYYRHIQKRAKAINIIKIIDTKEKLLLLEYTYFSKYREYVDFNIDGKKITIQTQNNVFDLEVIR